LTRKGVEVDIITTYRNGGDTQIDQDGDVKIYRINDLRNQFGKAGSTFSLDLLSISHYVREHMWLLERADVIHAFTPFFVRVPGVPLVSHFHHREEMCKGLSLLYQPTTEYLWRETYRRSDAIASVSRYSSKELLDMGIPESKIFTVYNGVDIERFNPSINAEEIRSKYRGKKLLLYVGPLTERKGLRYLLSAMPFILKEMEDVLLILVGSGDESPLKKMCDELGIREHVVFTGFIDEEHLPMYYSACDLFVFPSLQEGFGMVLTEAMACQKAVIASNNSAIPEVVGDTGILVAPRNPEALGAAVLDLLNDSVKRRDMEMLAFKRVRNLFTWDSVADRVTDMYGSVRRRAVGKQ